MEFSALPKADRCPEEGQLRRGPVIELPSSEGVPASAIASLLDLLDQPVLIADRAWVIPPLPRHPRLGEPMTMTLPTLTARGGAQ